MRSDDLNFDTLQTCYVTLILINSSVYLIIRQLDNKLNLILIIIKLLLINNYYNYYKIIIK